MNTYLGMKRERLAGILEAISKVRVGLIGDICLDVYWLADMRKSELSRETPHHPLPVVEERISLGGGGNAAANLAALKPERISVISVIGNDWRAGELTALIKKTGIDGSGLIRSGRVVTNAYIKPLRFGISDVVYEDPRLDFTSFEPISRETEVAVIEALQARASEMDILCVCDQLPYGVVTDCVRECILNLAAKGLPVVADSRDRAGLFTGITIKPNEIEGARAAGLAQDENSGLEDCVRIARALNKKTSSEVFMTLGARGSIYANKDEIWHVPARAVYGPIDFCGAGDSSLAGYALSLAAGAAPCEAAHIAGLCSEVTIKQIGVTGTASREQILARHDTAEVSN